MRGQIYIYKCILIHVHILSAPLCYNNTFAMPEFSIFMQAYTCNKIELANQTFTLFSSYKFAIYKTLFLQKLFLNEVYNTVEDSWYD